MFSRYVAFKKEKALLAIIALVGLCLPAFGRSNEADIQKINELIMSATLPEYAAGKAAEITQNLKSLSNNYLITCNEEDSLHELIRILNTTRSTYQALNHYVYGWNTTMEYQYRANVAAAKRGVTVSRTFIIADYILFDSEKLQNLLQILEIQKKDGIKVFYGLQRELEKEADYKKYVLMDVGLSDEVAFARVTAVSVKGPQPAQVFITWDKNIIQQQNPFPYLKKSQHIHPFDERAKKKILDIAAQKIASDSLLQ